MSNTKTVSYSQYKTWSTCPLMWKLQYVDGLYKGDSSIHTVFGDAIHKTIQTWLHNIEHKKPVGNLQTFFRTQLIDLFSENTILNEEKGPEFLCDKETLMEFYEDGCAILEYVTANKNKLFDLENWKLMEDGIEHRIEFLLRHNILYKAFLDLVFVHRVTGVIKIVDLKTSTSGWNDYKKKDKLVTDQILLYKKFYSKLYQVQENKIIVEFIILKRKVNENATYTIPRVTKFEPPHGTPSTKRAYESFEKFISEAFDDAGNYNSNVVATPSKSACKFCPFNNMPQYCTESYYKSSGVK